ncbi:MAG: tetratricopeptide repeat protein [Bacteroidetes bacterium]|jgi:tetratricopeptide (TPR) repeat protein|nr:tetratricopeptide repeat protein [Bacteroidota bacterium]
MKSLSYALPLLLGLLLLVNGCASSNPNLGEAQDALENRNFEQAAESIEQAMEEEPENVDIVRTKANIMRQWAQSTEGLDARTERFRAYRATLDQLLEMDPDIAGLSEAVETRALDETLQAADQTLGEEFEQAVEAFQRGQTNEAAYDTAAAYFQNAAILRPDLRDAHVNRAYALINAGRAAEAIPSFETALELGTEMEREMRDLEEAGEFADLPEDEQEQMRAVVEEDAELYVFIASIYAQEDRLEDAVDVLEQGRERFPQNEELQEQLLNAYVQTGQLDRATEQYAQAIEERPENAMYRYNYGSLLLEAGEYDAALEQLRMAVELEPGNADAHFNLGVAFINQAADVNDEVREMDDQLREQQSELSQEEIQEMNAQIDQLIEQRTELFEQSVEPLERARELAESGSETEATICGALIQAYANIGQNEAAQEAQQCADQM